MKPIIKQGKIQNKYTECLERTMETKKPGSKPGEVTYLRVYTCNIKSQEFELCIYKPTLPVRAGLVLLVEILYTMIL